MRQSLLSAHDRTPGARSRRGRRPACGDSCFPRFTAERLERGDSRATLAQGLTRRKAELGGERVDARRIERIETTGQRPTLALLRALAALWNQPLDAVRSLFREVA